MVVLFVHNQQTDQGLHTVHNNVKKIITPLLKYSIVGGVGTLIDILFLYFLVEVVGFGVFVATFCAFIIAATHNFFLNKFWTFENTSKHYRSQYIKFLLVSTVGLFLTMVSMYIFTTLIGLWYIFAKIITSGIIVLWNFFGNKLWTFKHVDISITHQFSFPHHLSIIVPAYNEEKRLAETIQSIINFMATKRISSEIIIVNDGSIDATANIAESLSQQHAHVTVLHFDTNQGKGAAVKAGIERSLGEYILFTDADNATPIKELDQFDPHKKNFDIIIGSRYSTDDAIKQNQPFIRRCIGTIGRKMHCYIVRDINDTQCGFKLFKHNVAKELVARQRIKRWGFDIELLSIAQKKNYLIKEVPVAWHHQDDSKVRAIPDSFKTVYELLFITYNHFFNHYD